MTCSPESLLADNLELVSLPDIVIHINRMVNDPACTAAEIGEMISRDTGLSMRLLKIVNSPMYGFPASIDTIPMAITVMGVRQVRDLVFSTCMIRKYSKIPSNILTPDAFWSHSIATAISAQLLARLVKISNSDRLFTCGMLHDIGLLIMALTRPDETRQVLEQARDTNKPSHDFQMNIFGFSQGDLAARLIRKWHLPESFIEPIQLQQINKAATRFPLETAILKVANVIANTHKETTIIGDNQIIHPGTLELLGLNEAALEDVHTEMKYKLDEALSVMYMSKAA
ncbi:HDOD domain-containing protein [Beggiatoa alba]|nr:HDOD domain-containing protein [Beggiatoa alba]